MNQEKKLMLLGGSRFLIPVIEAAHKLNCHVITCDYLPNNIAHKFSDQYVNVSIIDKNAVLEKAIELNIDGIMSFACDPGVSTAAYVAEKMGLPSVGSYESVSILQNKGLFRNFLKLNGFKVPFAKFYSDKTTALKESKTIDYPVIVKPTDSAGSKGVTRVDSYEDLSEAIDLAISFSIEKQFIIEKFLVPIGSPSDCDCFSVDGELRFISFNSQLFDSSCANPYTPAAYTWPSSISDKNKESITAEVQRLIKLLGLKSSIYNLECRECTDGIAYIMELSPRGGGNRLAEMIKYGSEIDLITCAVKAALGYKIDKIEQADFKGYWSEVILHSIKSGKFTGIDIDESLSNNVFELDLWVSKGDTIENFSAANKAIGTIVLRFDNKEDMNAIMQNPYRYITIKVE